MALSAVVWRKREGGMLTCSNILYSMEEKGKTKKGNMQLSRLVYVICMGGAWNTNLH